MSDQKPDWVGRLTEEARILGDARMLRDEQPYTQSIADEIIKRLNEFLDRTGRSREWAARSMAIAPTVLSQVCSGTYAADPEKHIRAIDKWLESQYIKEHAPRPSGFVRTAVAEQIYATAKYAIKTSCIVLVHGPAGIGKTITARMINADIPGSVFISVTTAGQTALAVMEEISIALRLAPASSKARLFNAIKSHLRDTGRLLIVDEVHKLEGRRKDEALHCLRDIHDATGVPMLWLGMTNIANYIQAGHSKGYEPLDQIYSRIGFWLNLTEVATCVDGGPGLATIEDVQKMLAASKVRFTPDAVRYLQMLASEFGAGAFRTVSKLVQLAENFSKDGRPVDAEMLRGIQIRRLGRQGAEALESRMQLRTAKAG